MTKIIAILFAIVLLVACSSATKNRHGTISFKEIDANGRDVRELTFLLTDKPAQTCQSGEWKRAKAILDSHHYTKNPAYVFENGKLQVLLVTGVCDSYDSYMGSLSGSVFTGEHVGYGLGSSEGHGTVSGTYSKP